MEKVGKLGRSFPGNLCTWWEILATGGKSTFFTHENMEGIMVNLTQLPGNKHFSSPESVPSGVL